MCVCASRQSIVNSAVLGKKCVFSMYALMFLNVLRCGCGGEEVSVLCSNAMTRFLKRSDYLVNCFLSII